MATFIEQYREGMAFANSQLLKLYDLAQTGTRQAYATCGVVLGLGIIIGITLMAIAGVTGVFGPLGCLALYAKFCYNLYDDRGELRPYAYRLGACALWFSLYCLCGCILALMALPFV